jgi:hypothetical protein
MKGGGVGGNVTMTVRGWMWVRAVIGMGILTRSSIKKFKTFLSNIILQRQEILSVSKKKQNYIPFYIHETVVCCFLGVTTFFVCIFHSPVAGFSLLILEVS